MKKNILPLLLLWLNFFTNNLSAQSIDKIINANEVDRIESILSSDSMQGRKTFTPYIDKAADFIAAEFKKNKLQFFNGLNSYHQDFTIIRHKIISAEVDLDAHISDITSIAALTTEADVTITNNSGYEKFVISKGADLGNEIGKYWQDDKNRIVFVDTSFGKYFSDLNQYFQQSFKRKNNVVFVLSATDPVNYTVHIKNEITELRLSNVVGVLAGKSKKDEYVIFSGHYDHLGIGKPDDKGDSIYNGANDDAAGTTAVIALSDYFSRLNNNERTLIFVAFTAEEIGGYGSQYFSKQLNADKVVAMFNIEMIGTESKWGTNSAYITGFEKSDFGKILQANLLGSKFHFEPDPYPKQNLFYRSDNATLAKLGVPAHTISTSKMEEPPNDEPNYHKQSDEKKTLDMKNMAEIIKAIAISSQTIVNAKDTPKRIEKRN